MFPRKEAQSAILFGEFGEDLLSRCGGIGGVVGWRSVAFRERDDENDDDGDSQEAETGEAHGAAEAGHFGFEMGGFVGLKNGAAVLADLAGRGSGLFAAGASAPN